MAWDPTVVGQHCHRAKGARGRAAYTVATPMELIERDVTLEQLRSLLRGAMTHGHVALVGAEAGAGKTSVLRALAAGHAASGGTVWWGACDALSHGALTVRTSPGRADAASA